MVYVMSQKRTRRPVTTYHTNQLICLCVYEHQVVPAALEIAMEEDVEFRQGLPLDYLTYMGVQNSDKVTRRLFSIHSPLPVNIPTTTHNEQCPPGLYRRTHAGQSSSLRLRA